MDLLQFTSGTQRYSVNDNSFSEPVTNRESNSDWHAQFPLKDSAMRDTPRWDISNIQCPITS